MRLVPRLALVLAAAGLLLAAAPKWPKPPEKKGWVPEGMNLAGPADFVNPDVVTLPGGGWRAYVMKQGQVLSLTSQDGLQWTLEPGVRVNGQHHAAAALEGGGWRLYYSTFGDPNLRSAVSSDGLDFAEEEGVRLAVGSPGAPDELGLIHPCVIALPGGGWRLYYDAVGSPEGEDDLGWNGIMSATSSDGLTWIKDEGFRVQAGSKPAGNADLVWSPFVEHDQGVFKLYYCTQAEAASRCGVRLALSWDGLAFSKGFRKPALRPDKGYGKKLTDGEGGPQGLPQDPFVVAVEGGKRMYYWLANEGSFSALLALEE